MSIKLYFDLFSQPSRAVLAFCKLAKIPHEVIEVRLNKKEQFSPKFITVNPLAKLPTIDDEGFILTESHAIMTFLARKYQAEEPFYPIDIYKRATVDSYLHWHHANTRLFTRLFQIKCKKFLSFKINYDQKIEEENCQRVLHDLDTYFLNGKKFLTDDKNMTIADISAACEIMQTKMLDNYDYSAYKNVTRWMERMMSFKEMIEVHEPFLKLANMAKSRN